jgi:hypothetical protein
MVVSDTVPGAIVTLVNIAEDFDAGHLQQTFTMQWMTMFPH